MKGIFLALVLAGGVAQVSWAADTQAARLAAARELAAVAAVQEGLASSLDGDEVQAAIDKDMAQRGIPAADRARVRMIFQETLADMRSTLIEKSIVAMARVYTVTEIKAMTAFARTPEGAAIQRKTGAFAAELTKQLAPLNEQIQRNVMTKLRRAFH